MMIIQAHSMQVTAHVRLSLATNGDAGGQLAAGNDNVPELSCVCSAQLESELPWTLTMCAY